MRLDPEHRAKLRAAVSDDATTIRFDMNFMEQSMDRLNLWEQGLLSKALLRAAKSRRKTPEQRALLALFIDATKGDVA